jgi:hypothetical protein
MSEEDTFTIAELRERLVNPSGPEDWSDIVAALADRLSSSLANGHPGMAIDEAAIVRNFAHAVADMAAVVNGFVGDVEHHEENWAKIHGHLLESASGLGWIAEGWI